MVMEESAFVLDNITDKTRSIYTQICHKIMSPLWSLALHQATTYYLPINARGWIEEGSGKTKVDPINCCWWAILGTEEDDGRKNNDAAPSHSIPSVICGSSYLAWIHVSPALVVSSSVWYGARKKRHH